MSSPSPISTHPSCAADERLRTDAPGLTRLGAPRLDMIDALRGLVIVLMVLDHVRDYFHRLAFEFNPLSLDQTTPILFATRWVTHLCAPSFVFLAGVSIFLQSANGKPRAQLSRFVLSRGLWLILLELTVIGFGFQFLWPFVFLQVIWAIGAGMVVLAALVWLPRTAVLMLGAIIVAGHGLLAGFDSSALGAWAPLWTLAMRPGPLPGIDSFVAYPAIPWIGIMLLGYGVGPLFLQQAPARRRALTTLALSMLSAFVVLRGFTAFGDPKPWKRMDDPWFDAMSFINVSKYPPSLLYVLVTIGVSLLLMLLLERLLSLRDSPRVSAAKWLWAANAGLLDVLLAFGRTPLFTYLLHIYLVHGSAMLLGGASGIPVQAFAGIIGNGKRMLEAGWGVSLPTVYLIWLLVLAALYPLSRAFAGLKRRRRDRWLSYL
ncbi:MAG: DUF1624 domain-containing protein [Lysobacter sp.]